MRSIDRRDDFWKGISIVIIILLTLLSVLGSSILASRFYINNIFVDHQHPVSAKWDTDNIKAGESPNLKMEFESYETSQTRFYDFLHLPNSLRINLSVVNVIILFLIISFIYLIGMSIVVHDPDDLEPLIIGWTSILPQVLLFFGLIILSVAFYHAPDLTTLGINDTQMADKATVTIPGQATSTVCGMLLAFVFLDVIALILFITVVESVRRLVKKIKAIIIDKLTLGNNIMLCCNNGRFELISIDFKLKWIPFPALFLEKRVLERFSARDASQRRLREWLGDLSIAVEEEHIQQLASLNMNGGSLLISPDNSVQIVKLQSAVEWRPFPRTVIHKEIVRRVSFDNFFRYLVADSKQVALDELKELLVDSYQERFETVGQTAVSALVKGVCSKALQTIKKSLPQIITAQNNLASQNAARLLQELTDEKLSAFKQEIVASIKESLEFKISRNIKEQILAPLKDVLSEQLPFLNDRGSIDALLDGTKFFFKHGQTQIIIVEQKPQRRSLYFERDFMGGGGRYNLAFPYVIFLLILSNNQFYSLHLYYANKPMTSLDSEVFRVNLPNVYGENKVCTGRINIQASSLAGKVEEVIAHFWQSQFNNDLSKGYSLMANRGGVFKNLSSWQKTSQNDPLFVLRVNWLECDQNYTPHQIVSRYMHGTLVGRITNFEHLIAQALQSEGVNIGALARQCCENIRIDRSYPKKTVNALKEELARLSQDLCQSFEEKLSDLLQSPDEKSLTAAVSEATAESVRETISLDFAGCAKKVLLRRRIDSHELINQILSQR